MSRRPAPRPRYDHHSSSSSSSSSAYSSSDSDDEDEHIITIDLDNTKLAHSVLAAKRTTTSDFRDTPQRDVEELRIAATVLSLSEEKKNVPTAKIVTTSLSKQDKQFDKGTTERWLHLRSDCVSFERFRRIALSFALRHQLDCITTLIYLLQHVQDNHEITSAYGSYIRPGTVLRCDGKDGKDRKQHDSATVSVTFTSYPYFDVSDGKWPEAPKDDSLHLSRGLFQQHYPQEVAQDRDREQSFYKFKKPEFKANQFLRVPQLWVLILDSSSVITCGPSELAATFQSGIEFVKEEVLLGAPSLVQVSAEFATKTIFYLPIESCKTFFALKATIEDECLKSRGYHIGHCILRTLDNEDLDAAQWLKLVQTKNSFFLHIRLLLRHQTKPLMIEPQRNPLAIEYADLSSDEDEKKALMILTPDRIRTFDSKIETEDPTAKNGDNRHDGDTTVIPTHPAFTWRDNISGNKPKIFRRPTGERDISPRKNSHRYVSDAPFQSPMIHHTNSAGIATSDGPSARQSVLPLAIEWHSTHTADFDTLEGSNSALGSDGESEIAQSASNEPRRRVDDSEPDDTFSIESGQRGYSKSIDLESHVDFAERRQSFDSSQSHTERAFVPDLDRRNAHNRRISYSSGQRRYQWVESDDESDDNDLTANSLQASVDDLPHTADHTTTDTVSGSDHQSGRSHARSPSAYRSEPSRWNRTRNPQIGAEEDDDSQRAVTRPRISILEKDTVTGAEAPPPRFIEKHNSHEEPPEHFDQSHEKESQTVLGNSKESRDKHPRESPMARSMTDLSDQIRRTIREELKQISATREEQEEKNFQQRHELEIRKRLGQFGFVPNQIDAILNPDYTNHQTQNTNPLRPVNGFPQVEPPTYVKVHKDHLDIETLHYYDLPYEWDSDGNHIIILREMSKVETEILFEHTRRLRLELSKQNKGPKSNRHRKQEHQPGRVERRAYKRGDPGVYNSRFYHAREKVDSRNYTAAEHKVDSQTHPDLQDNGFIYKSPKIDPDLLVPPFLAWPTTFGGDADELEPQFRNETATPTHPNGILIQLTLLSIEKRIHQIIEGRIGGGFAAAQLLIWKKGNDQVTIPERLIPRISLDNVHANTGPAQLPGFSARLQEMIRHVRDYLKTDRQESSHPPIDTLGGLLCGTRTKSRDVLLWQISRLCVLRDEFVNGTKELIGQFVPKHYSHPLVERCWGSLSLLDKIVIEMFQEMNRHQERAKSDRSPKLYVVRAIPTDNYSKVFSLVDLSLPISSCATCSSNYRYFDFEDARKHLRDVHTATSDADSMQNTELLTHWITTSVEVDIENKAEQFLGFLQVLNNRVNKLLSKAVDMRQSVANETRELEEGYLLPSSLVKAAEKIFQFVYHAAYSLDALHESGYAPEGPGFLKNTSDHRHNATGAEMFATIADTAMAKARDDLLLMAHTGDDQGSVVHIRSSPQLTMFLGLLKLTERPLMWETTVMQLYRSHLTTLRFEASRKPSKRILRELYLLDEEIEIVASVYQQQHDALAVLLRVLSSEQFLLSDKFLGASPTEKQIVEFRNDLGKIVQALRHNIEIAEEGNSKAILIFTLVTIIFLPLSFVSSVFGMNTTDIRDMNSDQTLFWAIALPVTAAIGGLSLIAAYGGVAIADGFHKLKTYIRKGLKPNYQSGGAWHREKRKGDEEKADVLDGIATRMHKRRQDFQHYESGLRMRWPKAKRTPTYKHRQSYDIKHSKSRNDRTSRGASKKRYRTVVVKDRPESSNTRSAESKGRFRGNREDISLRDMFFR